MSLRQLGALAVALLLCAVSVTALYLALAPLAPRLALFGTTYELQMPAAGALLGLWPLFGWGLLVSLADLPFAQKLLSLTARTLLLAVASRPRRPDAAAASRATSSWPWWTT